jgi:hypothetical protein
MEKKKKKLDCVFERIGIDLLLNKTFWLQHVYY